MTLFFQFGLLFSLACASFPGEADLVTSLPGVDQMPNFRIYSGYLTISASNGKFFFYTFVEAVNDTAGNQPVVRWFNGGPGCSSVGGGMFEEVGPLIPDGNGNLVRNPYSWNRLAHMLFIESPAGVGFSFSKTLSDYSSSDNSTAQDNKIALAAWLAKFPQYTNRPLFLAGESYAGEKKLLFFCLVTFDVSQKRPLHSGLCVSVCVVSEED